MTHPALNDSDHLAIRLCASVTALTRHLRAQAPMDGLGAARLSVLSHLYRLGTVTPTRLAREERVKLQTLTRLLAELEGEALLLRQSDPADARSSRLSLTAAGVQILSDEMRRREASLTVALDAALAPQERARLLDACALIDRVTLNIPAGLPPSDGGRAA